MDDHMSNNQTLSQILDEASKLDTADATRLICQILESVQSLNRSNKIHCNLCTNEILIDPDGNASLSAPSPNDVECSVDLPEFGSAAIFGRVVRTIFLKARSVRYESAKFECIKRTLLQRISFR